MVLILAFVIVFVVLGIFFWRKGPQYKGPVALFFLSVIFSVITGTAVSRFLPMWEGLVSDVGGDGAWIISAIYHLIYGLFIGIGATLSIFIMKKLGKAVHTLAVILASSSSVVLFDICLTIFGANIVGFFLLMLLLVILSCLINVVFALLFVRFAK